MGSTINHVETSNTGVEGHLTLTLDKTDKMSYKRQASEVDRSSVELGKEPTSRSASITEQIRAGDVSHLMDPRHFCTV